MRAEKVHLGGATHDRASIDNHLSGMWAPCGGHHANGRVPIPLPVHGLRGIDEAQEGRLLSVLFVRIASVPTDSEARQTPSFQAGGRRLGGSCCDTGVEFWRKLRALERRGLMGGAGCGGGNSDFPPRRPEGRKGACICSCYRS